MPAQDPSEQAGVQQQQQTPYLEPNHYKNNVILVSGGYDHSIRYWNADKGFCERIVQQPDNSHINAFAITPNREILASAGFQHVRLYDINSSNQSPLVNFEGLSKNVCSIGFNHHGNWLYTGGEDGYVRIWDVRNRALHCSRLRYFQSPVNSTFLHPNGVDIYVADQSGSIYIWNLHKDKLHRLFVTSEGFVQSIAYDKDSRLLAAVDTRGNCYIFRNSTFIKDQMDESTGELTQNGFYQRRLMFQAHSKYALKCAFSPDSALLATSSADKTVKLWSTSDFSVANTTSVVQFDDPYEAMAKNESGLGNGNGSAASFKNTFSSLDSEGAEVLDPSIANTNPTTAFMNTPYFVGLFNHNIQQPRPPPCYLRPKKLCQKCLDKRTSASTDQRTPEGVQAALAAGAGHANSNDSIAGGRSLYHSQGCKQAYSSSSNALGSVIPMQPTLNSLNQLTWNLKTPGKKLSDPGTCNHYSHYPYRSPTHRASVHSFPSSTDASTSKASSLQTLRKSDANLQSQVPTSTSSHGEYTPFRRFPVIAAKYFDNKYYEIHSGHEINTDSEEEEGEADLPKEARNRIKLEREDRKMIRRHRREQQLADEKEEFYRLLKKSQLVDSSEESDEEERLGGDEDSGLTMKSDFASKNVERMNKRRCCVECGTCYCYSGGNTGVDQEGVKSIGRSRHPSGNPIAPGSQLTGGKNEWNFTSTLTPKLTLKAEQQRWVWDLAFSADSQYIFTASSDNFVRLWSAFTGELTREYTGHQKAVMALGFSDLITD